DQSIDSLHPYVEENGEMLVAFINSSQPEKLREVKVERQALVDRHLETKKTVTQILKADVAQIEERAGQRLLNMEEQKQHRQKELEDLEEQLQRCTAKSQITDSEIQFLQTELESVRNTERELETLQNEVHEDTTEVIPSAFNLVFFFLAVHYGPDLATPINIDTSVRSRSDISDQLWDFVSTEW
uniref:Kinetochore protein Spc24 n=1 Tax=Xiphophorus couchianus TaxID=32473 RepID=A0A3B5MN47_9TELE